MTREDRRLRPLDLQLSRSLHDFVLDRTDHSEEVAVAHDLHVRKMLDRARIDRQRLCETVRQPRTLTRPHPTCVQHARDLDRGHVRVMPGHLLRDVHARRHRPDQLVVLDGLRRRNPVLERGRRQRDVEELPADELAVRGRLAAARDDALRDRQVRNRRTEARRSELQQLRPGRDRGRADAMAGARHRVRAADAARQTDDIRVVDRAQRLALRVADRVAVDHLAEVHVELLGGNHQEARRDALTDLTLARQQRDGVVSVHPQPRIELGQRGVVSGRRRRRERCTGFARKRGAGEAEADDHRAAALDERLA